MKYLIKLCQTYRELAVIVVDVACKITWKTVENWVWINVQMNNFWNTQSNFTLISLITFEVLNQTSSNLQGTCRNSSRCCLQTYMENGWELTSDLTSRWITFEILNQNFTLISLLTFEVLNQTLSNLQGTCRNSSRCCLQNYMENGWELTSELTSKWITFEILNQISH